MTYADIGQRVKQKYPQYKDLNDDELGKRMVERYPTYKDMLSQSAQASVTKTSKVDELFNKAETGPQKFAKQAYELTHPTNLPKLNLPEHQNSVINFLLKSIPEGIVNQIPSSIESYSKLEKNKLERALGGEGLSTGEKIGESANVAMAPLMFMGGGAPANIVKTGVKQGGKEVLKQILKGVFTGAKYGGAFGGLGGLYEGKEEQIPDQVKQALVGAGLGSLLGGAVGGVTSGVNQGIRTVLGQKGTQAITKGTQAVPEEKVIPLTEEQQLRNTVSLDLNRRLAQFETKVFEQATPTIEQVGTGTKKAGLFTRIAREGQEEVSKQVEKGLINPNPVIRNASSILKGFFGGLGRTQEQNAAAAKLKGGVQMSFAEPYQIYKTVSQGYSRNSLKRVASVLDPDLAEVAVKVEQLTPEEKTLYQFIREGNDLIHDWNFSNGFLSKKTYLANKGKYNPRGYEPMEAPPEIDAWIRQNTQKLDLNPFKKRGNITDWMKENNLNDPLYMMSKRLQQTMMNDSIVKYINFLKTKSPNLISNVEKPGFTQLSKSPAYGDLSGKWVANHVAEDFKGYFFTNQMLQGLYDVFKIYDQNPLRQMRKAMLIAYNPLVQLGNASADNVFGWMVGVNPVRLNSNLKFATKEVKNFGPMYRLLLKNNILRTDLTKADLTNSLYRLESLTEKAANSSRPVQILNTGKSVATAPLRVYAAVDDVYKLAAFKSLLDMKKTPQEALRLVSEGFQNYTTVGKFYDVAARTPIIGNAFIRFQNDLMRIIKNGMVNRPLGTASFLASLYTIAKLSSMISGEDPYVKKTREERGFIPKIPGLDIPLVWQTPFGEVNVARYVSPFYAYTEFDDPSALTAINNLMPYQLGDLKSLYSPTAHPGGGSSVTFGRMINDPLLGPLAQLAMNSDFRGKPIIDPDETKYQASTLTADEKAENAFRFLVRSYSPQTGNDIFDLFAALSGNEDYYGRTKTPEQAFLRLFGIRLEQYGKTEALTQLVKEAQYRETVIKSKLSQINTIKKDFEKGEINEKTARERLKAIITEIAEHVQELKQAQLQAQGVVGAPGEVDVEKIEKAVK